MSDKLGLVWLATDTIWDSASEDMKSGVEAYSRSVGVDGFFQVTDESLMFTDMGQTVTLKDFDPRYIDEAPKLAQRIHELLSAASLRARPQEPGDLISRETLLQQLRKEIFIIDRELDVRRDHAAKGTPLDRVVTSEELQGLILGLNQAIRSIIIAPSGPLSDPDATKGENNESKAVDSNEVRDGSARVGDREGTEERRSVHPVVDVARQVVQGSAHRPLVWADTEFEYPDRHEAYKQYESHVGGWVIQEFPEELGGGFRLLNEIGVELPAREDAERLAQSLNDVLSAPLDNLESRGPLSDEPRENENPDVAAPVLGGETK